VDKKGKKRIKNPLVIAIGKRIKEAREKIEMTQKELAKILKTEQQYIDRYEKGTRPPIEEMPRIAEALGVLILYIRYIV